MNHVAPAPGLGAAKDSCVAIIVSLGALFFIAFAWPSVQKGHSDPLAMVIGFSTLALTNPSISFIGQLTVLLLFCGVAYGSYRRGAAPAASGSGPMW